MWNYYIWFFTLFTLVFTIPKRLHEGDVCQLKNGNTGICKQLSDCPKVALDIVENPKLPEFCVWRIYKPVVCCDNSTTVMTEVDTDLLDEPKKSKNMKFNTVKSSVTTELSSITTELPYTRTALNIATQPLLTKSTLRVPPCARHKAATLKISPTTTVATTKAAFDEVKKTGIKRTSSISWSKKALDGSTRRKWLPQSLRENQNKLRPLNGTAESGEKGKLVMANPADNEVETTTTRRLRSFKATTTTSSTTKASTTTKTTQIPFITAARIAEKKCQEYSSWLDKPVLINDGPEKIPGSCFINAEKFISGGNKTAPREFPHMAHLGYGQGNITFHCGASLISEKFLLTAGHCFTDSKKRYPTVAKLSTGDFSEQWVKLKKEGIFHPEYIGGLKYNDIALIALEDPVTFTDYMRPACIQIEKDFDKTEGIATGWGNTGHLKGPSDVLLKVNLTVIETSKCSSFFKRTLNLPRGIDDKSMICAGGTDGEDTCPGDSGGPLQIVKHDPKCMYSIVGVTSFGHKCGTAPAIYTRVSNYIPWIVSKVWPEELENEN